MFLKNPLIASDKFNKMQLKAIECSLKMHNLSEISCLKFKGNNFFSNADVIKIDFIFLDCPLRAFDIQGLNLFITIDESIEGICSRLNNEIELIKSNFLKAVDDENSDIDLLLEFMSYQLRDLKRGIMGATFNISIINYVYELHRQDICKRDIFLQGMDYIFRNKHRIDIFIDGSLGNLIYERNL